MTDQNTIVALTTYGTHTKTRQGKRLSTLKIGYTGIIHEILLALFSDATDVSSNRDSYKYIHLPNKPKLHHNWLFIELNPTELATFEAMTVGAERSSGIAVWKDSKWMMPPSQHQPQYHEPRGAGDAPNGSAAGYWALSTDGKKGPTGGSRDKDLIIADYSKLDPHKSAWWWIAGNSATYNKLADLKRQGCRWKKKRRAFAYVGDTLPNGLLDLLDNADECRAIMSGMSPDEAKAKYRYSTPENIKTDTDESDGDSEPCSVEEAAAILGVSSPAPENEPPAVYERGRVAWTTNNIPKEIEGRTEHIPVGTKYMITDIDFSGDPLNPVYIISYGDNKTARVLEEEIIPRRVFKLGDTVFARYETKTSAGEIIQTGAKGLIKKLYRFNRNLGLLRGHTYDVEWEGIGVEWMIEDELSPLPTESSIRITKGQFVPGGEGSTPAEERKAIIDAGLKPDALAEDVHLCVCEECDGPTGWLPAANLGTWVACGVCNPDGKNLPQEDPTNPDAKPPAIRIIKPTTLDHDDPDDEIAQAIRASRDLPTTTHNSSVQVQHSAIPLPMECVGELTGSVTANVHCYGYAVDGDQLVFLNMGGPRSGIEAIRAKLSKGDIVNLMRWDAPSIELTAGEGNTGVYTAIINNMSEARFVHCILVHERMMEPNYSGKSTTYIIQMSEEQAKGQLLHHVRETVRLPVFSHWIEYLWTAGETAKLIRNTRTGGGLVIKTIDLDVDAWGRLIQYGIAEKVISIPEHVNT
ncbi:MAG: hypothetical protein AAFN11_00020 [Chloroflexota bacterium]